MKLLPVVALACFMLIFYGCAGTQSSAKLEAGAESQKVAVRDSLKAKFLLTVVDSAGKQQELDAVLFAVPGKRYRMELTGPMGIGVASLLWTEQGWDMVFPTEKMYLHGNGYMVGLLGDNSIPMVPIHQVADLFDGILVPENSTVLSESDSAGFHVVQAKAPNGMNFAYGLKIDDKNDPKEGSVEWLSRGGRDGSPEILKFSDFRTFENVRTPESIVFERDGKMFLKIKIKKVTRGKAFSLGIWRLNVPKSYKPIDG